MIKADLHVHTYYSDDSVNSFQGIIDYALKRGLDCINICDHNTTAGAIELQKIAPIKIIISEEIETTEGEIMGVFLKNTVPAGLTPEETITLIREQEGLVLIPHPGEKMRSSSMQAKTLERIKHLVDIIEVANAKTWPFDNVNYARRFATENNLIASAGSDAHTLSEIGSLYMIMPDFDCRDSFMHSLSQGTIEGPGNNITTHCYSLLSRQVSKIGNRITHRSRLKRQ